MAAKDPSRASRSEADDEATAFLRNMHQFNRGISRKLTPIVEQEHGIDLRLYFILKYIEHGVIHPSAISQATHLPNSVITRHIDQLVERGLLQRSLDTEDSRRTRLLLTDDGLRIAHAADASLSRIVHAQLNRVPADRRGIFLSVLSELAGEVEK